MDIGSIQWWPAREACCPFTSLKDSVVLTVAEALAWYPCSHTRNVYVYELKPFFSGYIGYSKSSPIRKQANELVPVS
jgi:hypothetical protein